MPAPYDLGNHVRDDAQVKKGGSNRLAVGITDAQADDIWGERFSHAVAEFDDTDGEILVDGDQVYDFLVGASWRVRESGSNDGLFTVADGVRFDADNNQTIVPVEETVSTETVSGTIYFEPIWLAGGWHLLSYNLQGGTITNERSVDRIFNEVDEEIAEVVNSEEDQIGRTSAENDERFKLLLQWLEDHYVEARDFLPVTSEGQYFEADNGDLYAEGRFWPHLSANKESYEESVARDESRTHDFTLSGTRDPDTGEVRYERVVNITDQTGWPSDLSPFKDDAYSTSRTTA